jgi:adenine phosphoribosyltransferase
MLRQSYQELKMSMTRQTHTVKLAGITRKLPLFEVAPGVRIAIFNMLGDTEIVQVAAKELAKRLPKEAAVLVTAEAKSIPLAHALSVETGLPYCILRKSYKPYMGDAISAETLSITTGEKQTLYLDEKDRGLIADKQVAIVDDVISTGSTLQGMQMIIEKAGGKVIAQAAVFTEGERAKWKNIIALGHLPLFTQ